MNEDIFINKKSVINERHSHKLINESGKKENQSSS